jgi:hypothetical protein
LIFLLKFIETDKKKYIILSGLFVAFFGWTRYSEPTHWVFILTLGYALIMKKMGLVSKMLLLSFYSVMAYSSRLFWKLYVNLVHKEFIPIPGLRKVLPLSFLNVSITKIIEVISFIFISLTPLSYYFLIPLTLLLLVTFRRVRLGDKEKILLIILGLFIGMMIAGTFVFSVTREYWKELSGSLLRVSFFLIPATMFFSASLLERLTENNVKN